MPNSEKFLPFIISLLLPGLNVLSNNRFYTEYSWYEIAPKWLIASFFLFGLWKLTEYFFTISDTKKKWIFISFGSLISITLFLFSEHYLFPAILQMNEVVPIWAMGIKLILGAILIVAIIESLRTAKEREQFRIENSSLQTENLNAQLNQLRQQVNPHFLFNCLSTLRTMVRSGDSQSEEYVLKLSDVYRQILQKKESAFVTLKEEIEFLNSYLYLLKLRHEKSLFFEISISADSLIYNLPIFSLQLLIENCIKHNIVSENKPLHIHIFQTDNQNITISNNYQPKKDSIDSLGLGIENLKLRYELLGIKNGLQTVQTESEYSVILKLF
jgi:sensor histidine kinase YesM